MLRLIAFCVCGQGCVVIGGGEAGVDYIYTPGYHMTTLDQWMDSKLLSGMG